MLKNNPDFNELRTQFQKKEIRSLSKLITQAENQEASCLEFLGKTYGQKRSHVIGMTGLPGAGKSTLINYFLKQLEAEGKTAAVLAVDPMSAASGGALLGDRIRLSDHYNNPSFFIRSLSTRGKLGGLSMATPLTIELCEQFGFDYIFVESVGVGQNEIEIQKWVDFSIVILYPGGGDDIQAIKAGIFEIADCFIVNKSEKEGADSLLMELKNAIELSHKNSVLFLKTSLHDTPSIHKAWNAILPFFSNEKSLIECKRKNRTTHLLREFLEFQFQKQLNEWLVGKKNEIRNPFDYYLNFLKNKVSFFEEP